MHKMQILIMARTTMQRTYVMKNGDGKEPVRRLHELNGSGVEMLQVSRTLTDKVNEDKSSESHMRHLEASTLDGSHASLRRRGVVAASLRRRGVVASSSRITK
jgi:hypothetical protein